MPEFPPDTGWLLGWKTFVVATWFAVIFCWEHLKPAVPWIDPRRAGIAGSQARRIGHNLIFWGLNLFIPPLVVIPLTIYATEHGLAWRPASWQGSIGLLVDVVLLDCWIYWWHRWNHEIPFLWRFHQVHHFDWQLDASSAVRFHFGEVVLGGLARMPVILVLGVPLVSVIVFEALVLLGAIFHHSNVRLVPTVESALSRLVITPGIHWVHHHAMKTDTDSNYGTLFSFWDRLFSSRSASRRTSNMEIGIEGRHEGRLVHLLLMPFKRSAGAL